MIWIPYAALLFLGGTIAVAGPSTGGSPLGLPGSGIWAQWRSLNEGSLCAGASLIPDETTFLGRHRDLVISTAGLIAAESALIAMLLVHRRRRRASAGALRELNRRLVTAQEAGKVAPFEWFPKENKYLWSKELKALYGIENGANGGKW